MPTDNHKTDAERYAAELGDEARERQERLAKERFVCCGMPRANGHHDHCPNRPDEPVAVVIPGQESLL